MPPSSGRTTRERLIQSIDERREGDKGDQKVEREEQRKLPAFHVQVRGFGQQRIGDVPRNVRNARAPEKEREEGDAEPPQAPRTDGPLEGLKPRREFPCER